MENPIPALASPDQKAPLIMVEPTFAEDFRGSATKAGLEMIPTAASGDGCNLAVFQFAPGTDVERFAKKFNAMVKGRPWWIVQRPPSVPEMGKKRPLPSGCPAGG